MADVSPDQSYATHNDYVRAGQASNLVFERPLINTSNKNSAVNYFIDLGDVADHPTRTRLSLLSQLINEPAFNQLRTQEQLGYAVHSYSRRASGQCGFMMMIQSERPPAFVESRIENFLNWFLEEKLKVMEPEEFEEQKRSLINKSTEDVKNLREELSVFLLLFLICPPLHPIHRQTRELRISSLDFGWIQSFTLSGTHPLRILRLRTSL